MTKAELNKLESIIRDMLDENNYDESCAWDSCYSERAAAGLAEAIKDWAKQIEAVLGSLKEDSDTLKAARDSMVRVTNDPYLTQEGNAEYAAGQLFANARKWAAGLDKMLGKEPEGK